MSNTRTSARPIVVIAVTISALLLLHALHSSTWWQLPAGFLMVLANVLLAIKYEDSRKSLSVGAVIATLSCVVGPVLG